MTLPVSLRWGLQLAKLAVQIVAGLLVTWTYAEKQGLVPDDAGPLDVLKTTWELVATPGGAG